MMSIPQHLLIDTDLCTACRACELVCHYHHEGTFGADAASVRIDYDADTGGVRIQMDSTCDSCVQEPESLCARYCGPGAIRIG